MRRNEWVQVSDTHVLQNEYGTSLGFVIEIERGLFDAYVSSDSFPFFRDFGLQECKQAVELELIEIDLSTGEVSLKKYFEEEVNVLRWN